MDERCKDKDSGKWKVFVYETLMNEDVRLAVLRDEVDFFEAEVQNMKEISVDTEEGTNYHTLIDCTGEYVMGKVLLVDDSQLSLLDWWEAQYRRMVIKLADGACAFTYVAKKADMKDHGKNLDVDLSEDDIEHIRWAGESWPPKEVGKASVSNEMPIIDEETGIRLFDPELIKAIKDTLDFGEWEELSTLEKIRAQLDWVGMQAAPNADYDWKKHDAFLTRKAEEYMKSIPTSTLAFVALSRAGIEVKDGKVRKSDVAQAEQVLAGDYDDSDEEDVDDGSDEGQEEDQPEDYDGYISPTGPLGSQYSVSIEMKHLGDFDTIEEAEEALKEYCDKRQFWPNIWSVSDHGDMSLHQWSTTANADPNVGIWDYSKKATLLHLGNAIKSLDGLMDAYDNPELLEAHHLLESANRLIEGFSEKIIEGVKVAASSNWDKLVELADATKDDESEIDEDFQAAVDLLAQTLNGGFMQYLENDYGKDLPKAKAFLAGAGEKSSELVSHLGSKAVLEAKKLLKNATEENFDAIVDGFNALDSFVFENIEEISKELMEMI